MKKIQSELPVSTTDRFQGAIQRAGKLDVGQTVFTFRSVTEEEVAEIVRKTKGSTCPDYHGLSPEIIKKAGAAIIAPLTWIVNMSIREGVFPAE